MTSALRRQAYVIVCTLATAYVASHFFRASNVTIGLDLMRDLSIGPEALGAQAFRRGTWPSWPLASRACA